jgi:hypothetical protein
MVRVIANVGAQMSIALQFVPLLVFLSLIALCVLVWGRVLAATKIPALALGLQALIGAFYLGPRVKKDSGFDRGPVTGAKVAAGGAFVSLLIFAGLMALVWFLRGGR